MAVYIMILPGMGVISEIVPCFSRKRIFGYNFVAMSSVGIAVLGFLVWAHHMFVAGISVYSALIFSMFSYPPEFQVLNVLSTAGASVLAVGYLLPMIYFVWSLRYGKAAPDNPWKAAGLEWMTPSPSPTYNFDLTPTVTWEAYNYDELDKREQGSIS